MLSGRLFIIVFLWGVFSLATQAEGQGRASATVRVDAGQVLNKITPWMTGACLDDINHQIYGGLYAQKLFGESFEEPPPVPKGEGVPSVAVSGMWDAVVTGEAKGEFSHEQSGAFNGAFCQKIVHGAGGGQVGIANRGLNRWGISVKKGEKLGGRLYLRADQLDGSVTVALQSVDGKKNYATRRLPHVTEAWTKIPFELTPNTTDKNARFAVWIDRPGTLWIDQAVLIGTGKALFHGLPIRADIAQGLVEEGIKFLRYGGGMVNASGYRWKNMIGDPDKRPPYTGTWYAYSSNGFGIFDFLNFCETAQIEAAFAINSEESEQDAADLVDYLTAPVTNPWGARRAADGHPAPYQFRYIEIGNEEAVGSNSAAAYRHYAERFRLLARAIHGRNTNLQLVCAAWWLPESPWMKTVFDAVDGAAAAWDLHVDADDPRAGITVAENLAEMQTLFQQWNPETKMRAVLFEENGNRHDMQRALGHATTLNAARRFGDFVLVDCPANGLQPWMQNDNGWDQGQLFFTADHVWAMPPYYVQLMAARSYQPNRVESAAEGSPDLDALAARSDDGKTLVLTIVNVGRTAQRARVQWDGMPPGSYQGSVWTLAGPLQGVNMPDQPESIRPVESLMISKRVNTEYTLPPNSYTIIQWKQISAR